ncbi:YtxH domain-containing protein [Aphanizomenon flos-aquae NRERC-008]|jgi:gas vesicle protein|uniref:Gas vesicle protein n=3 Tax=Aphanizomenon flos-aquae TaxID=1176 RepID=A0A1B7WZF5_APHFL|nr:MULTISPECIES: YtxH domain-containing protein [Aphanizomenon]MBD1218310.1 YtxH domain-containing protein [Aphanizomenon flos-aquae Clear-A1]MBO1042687.1 YtxH domain-containing protein [Aphanizomenon flos-aquae UKL13-PB]MBO1062710.1 YtxH domain-containing protein [Aphanizomenon flos-aquae CP01]MCE2904414.1 YtxH domain-containing protein [Anabaena sp. CoA2_C59]MDJ0503933.1 YtxH domain-containing protein [Nostocales cyanobacterium LE14-WE12]NTW19198.1 YtxH domain-containing protein [Nostocales
MSKNRSGIFIGGLILGAAIGTLAGLLVAPRTGRETRKLVKKSANAIPELAEDISSSVQIQANRLSTSTLQNWDETVDRLREAIAIGIDATQRESQSLNKKNTVDVSSTTDSINPLTEKIERL